jgi:hypothetical protein
MGQIYYYGGFSAILLRGIGAKLLLVPILAKKYLATAPHRNSRAEAVRSTPVRLKTGIHAVDIAYSTRLTRIFCPLGTNVMT